MPELDFTDAKDMKQRGCYLYPFTMQDVTEEAIEDDKGDHTDLPIHEEPRGSLGMHRELYSRYVR